MPTLLKNRENQWLARVIIHGRQVASKYFPAGTKYGLSWRRAKKWEEEQKEIALNAFEQEKRALALKAWKLDHDKFVQSKMIEEQKIRARKAFELQQEELIRQKEEQERENKLLQSIQEEQKNFVLNLLLSRNNQKESEEIFVPKEKTVNTVQSTSISRIEKASPHRELLSLWQKKYLEHVTRSMSKKTFVEKQTVMDSFFAYCKIEGIESLYSISPAVAYDFLSEINDERGGNVANKYRKNLLAAWTWGINFIDSFPQENSPFAKVKPFNSQKQDRYVPPEADIIKVLHQAKGQDLIMLLVAYFTGARRGEIFRLSWQDINLETGKIRLSDRKAGNGQGRIRWLQMHEELVKALLWWKENRPCQVDNVFMQIQSESTLGQPYTQRNRFMISLCEKAKVKPFGFHAIRHKSASITFTQFGLNAAQILMGHYRSTTTDIYTKSAGLYSNQNEIVSALGESGIGQAVVNLLQQNISCECYA